MAVATHDGTTIPNRMEVRVRGGRWSAFVNGTEVGRQGAVADGAVAAGGQVGVAVGMASDNAGADFAVRFDDLAVYELA